MVATWPSSSYSTASPMDADSRSAALALPPEHGGDDRTRLGRLPRLVRLASRLRPLDVDVDPRPEPAGAGQHPQRGLQHESLHRPVARPPERMAERELDTDDPRPP